MTATEVPECLVPLYEYLNKLDNMIDEIPPIAQPMRFGNKAFQTWLKKLREGFTDEMKEVLKNNEDMQRAIIELEPYFTEAFGNYERIDYGTGHELSFLGFLMCLYKIGFYNEEHFQGLVNKVFQRYLTLCRKLQTTYMLEPAGSHGVWGLDDYQHLPFIFGAGQLVGHEEWTPEIIHDNTIVDRHINDYMYFGCIQFIKSVKKGVPFGESSPTLNDVSGVPNWGKVAQGMVKMYQGEVLNKHPVVKHFKFGSLIPFNPSKPVEAEESSKDASEGAKTGE